MTNHISKKIIHKENNTYWPDILAHLVMDYLENEIKPDDTMARVEFKNS